MGEGLLHKEEMDFPSQNPDLWGPFLSQAHHPRALCDEEGNAALRERDWQPAFAICSGPSLRIHNKQAPQSDPHKHLVDHMQWEHRHMLPAQ